MGSGHGAQNPIAYYGLIYIFRFLLASLNIEAILQEPTIHRRRERLSNMTDGLRLEDVYGATIERIKAQGGYKTRLGMGALMWISYAEVPLSPDELCHALAIELGSTDFNISNIPSIMTLVSCCQGFITVDKEASTVRLIHFTLREYFSAHPDIFIRPHSVMAEICLTYLNSQQVKALSANSFADLPHLIHDKPFLKYCSRYWGVHAKKELSDCASALALQLFKEYDGHISAALQLFKEYDGHISAAVFVENILHMSNDDNISSPWNGLHCASSFGIVEVVAALIYVGCYDPNERDCRGYTALSLAAMEGHEEVVKILLGQEEVDPNTEDKYGATPLLYAADKGHEGVVKILLGRGEVNPDKPDGQNRTPLWYAACWGREGVVRILLEREEVNPDRPDNHGRAPISYAARNGHGGVVKILLEREEVSPDKPGNTGRTPLSYAAGDEHARTAPGSLEEVVKLLLGRDEVNPDMPDIRGQTPLSHAAGIGNEGIMKILLGRKEVSPDKPDNHGRTPLSYAAGGRYEFVDPSRLEKTVELLLGRDEVNPDGPDNEGRTPLSYAAWGGYERIVKILLGRKEVNPDKLDYHSRTPLSYAAGNHYAFQIHGRPEEVVKLLLGREEVNPNQPDWKGQTPLMLAIKQGNHGVVALIRSHEAVTHSAT